MDDHALCDGSQYLDLFEGEVLIDEGDSGDTAYLVVTGEVLVWKAGRFGPIELARLGPGAILGEMSIVDDKPRSASVRALCSTRVKCIRRSHFLDSFKSDPHFAASLLKILLERLRETGARLAELGQVGSLPISPGELSEALPLPSAPLDFALAQPLDRLIVLEGATAPAREALPCNPFVINHLPFRIGRQTNDPLANNDLSLSDFEPFQVSIHHLLIFKEISIGSSEPRIGIFDRGSAQGTWINGAPLGGLMADGNATYLDDGEADLVFGPQDSLLRYRLKISSANRL